ncbi:MAG: class I SAM-dependent methyltransferase [Candidatus Binatia bacterium]
MTDHDTLCGWGEQEKVAYFFANVDTLIPKRSEQLRFLVDLFVWPPEVPITVLDLGAGFGAVTEEILTRYPHSTVSCVDGSAEMMRLARERLAKYGERVRLYFSDLASPSWHDNLHAPFHAVVSGIAIHHLTDERKRELYREVFTLLSPGGLFLNNDAVTTPPSLKERFEAIQYREIQEQERIKRGVVRSVSEIQADMTAGFRTAGPPSPISPLKEQLDWLKEAGFESVDCFWKFLNLAIFGGVKGKETSL